ncbi:hypothetical protein [Tabrizicola sp. BL-A-41-H6]|uniref:hypothetical protein n=1 Tax=Tabrizicola sp. BL-A-41-H6 TaxID=3421107 RepID=UPI003D67C0E8
MRAVIYATGSSIVVEFEESLSRAGIEVVAGIRNRTGPCHLSDPALSVPLAGTGAALRDLPFIVPLFTPANRRAAVTEARSQGFATPLSLIDPTVIRPRDLPHGEGLYVNAGVIIGAGTRFGDFVVVNRGAVLGHHLTCGNYVSIGPAAVLAGMITLGDDVVIGVGAVILPEVKIGAGALVAAGAVVGRDVPAGATVAGNPARIVRRGGE